MSAAPGSFADERSGSAPWPDWDGLSFDDIVKYINPAELEDAAIAPWVRFNYGGEDDALALLSQTYRYLLSLRIRYGLEPWISGKGQRIRWPALVRRDCGTCLDMAVLYVSILLRCQFRPLLFFIEGRVNVESHVLVGADTRIPLQDAMMKPATAHLPFARDTSHGQHAFRMPKEGLPDGFVLLDPTSATVGPEELTYEEAEESANALIRDNTKFKNIIVLDVASAIQQQAGAPYPIPNESTGASAVWTRLPQRYVPPPLADTHHLLDSVRATDGKIAIVGESGTGKSTIAYLTAADWDNGYGWFVNAADRSTLQAELSYVELMQRSRSLATSQIEDDQIALSRAALRRLGQSRMPWVVVVDNADNEPSSIIDLLPIPAWPGQVVIVTSTHPAWSSWADRCLTFGRMGLDGSRVSPGVAVTPHAPRRAIEVDIRSRLLKRSVVFEDDDLAELVASCRGQLSTSIQEIAIDIAWAPAAALDVSSVMGRPSRLRTQALRELEELGLLGLVHSRAATVTMHRAIAAEIRKWDPETPVAHRNRLVRLMMNEHMVPVLAERAEESVLLRLISLAENCAYSLKQVRALYLLSEVLELRGMSAEAAGVAGLCFARPNNELSVSEAALAHLRVVRHTKNHVKDAASLQGALDSVTDMISRLPEGVSRAEKLVRYQCVAMQGHVRRQLAKRSLRGGPLMSELEGAKEMLLESVAGRAEIVGPADWRRSVERELSLFNVAAISLDLGKSAADDPVRARVFLGDSLHMYTLVRNAIHDLHGYSGNHPRRAAAEYGRALCFYYSALLGIRPEVRSEDEILGISAEFISAPELDDPYPAAIADESVQLVAAHEALLASLRERMGLQVGKQDSADVVKCLRLGIEISAARIAWAAAGSTGAGVRELSAASIEELLVDTEQNFRADWKTYGRVSVGEYEAVRDAKGDEIGYERLWRKEGRNP
ncbi:hypothetical protein [Amycolatopsis sp. GM8]|uniref:hypothetical protein n=1 Tax=Amycolatopsis sp. GM8 TaxID=2896530 RepID=UPI001F292026|nr:hypothetical protein [Amycolatopsis sp. GM8]